MIPSVLVDCVTTSSNRNNQRELCASHHHANPKQQQEQQEEQEEQQPTCNFQTIAPSQQHRDQKSPAAHYCIDPIGWIYFRAVAFMQSARLEARLHKQTLGCDLFPLIMHS